MKQNKKGHTEVCPYQPIESKIEKVITETPNIKTFVFKPVKPIHFATGQFVEITVPGVGEAPFTPSSSPYEKEKLEVTIMKAGRVTSMLHQMKEGDTVGLRGPYGNGYPIEKYFGKEVLILGGGVGLAPLRSFLLTLLKQKEQFKKIYLCYGCKTPDDVVYKSCFPDWQQESCLDIFRSVDKADEHWKESQGVVTVLLDKVKWDLSNTVVIVCGPPIMMKFGVLKLIDVGFKPEDIYLSLERNMSCGLGKCGHCGLGKHYICKDGPVFTYDVVKDIPKWWD